MHLSVLLKICWDSDHEYNDRKSIYLPRQVTKIVLKTFENQEFFQIRPELTTLLRQMKSSYDKYVVKEVKMR